MGAADLLGTGIKKDKVFTEFEKARGVEQLTDLPAQQVGLAAGGLVLPLQVVLLGGAGGAVAQALALVSGNKQLLGSEKVGDELVALVGDELANAVADADHRPLELDHAQCDAIDVEHDVGPLDVGTAAHRDLLGEGEVVKPVVLPVDVVDVHLRPAGTGPDLGPVA